MMKNYTIKPNKKKWDVYEIPTEQIIETLDYKNAKIKMDFYNTGGGFDGNTPKFMICNYDLNKYISNIDDKD